jgi:hypothetical protein
VNTTLSWPDRPSEAAGKVAVAVIWVPWLTNAASAGFAHVKTRGMN